MSGELAALEAALAALPADTTVTAGMLVDKLHEAQRASSSRSSDTRGALPERRCSGCRCTKRTCDSNGTVRPCCARCDETDGRSHG